MIYNFKIASRFPVGSEITYEELSDRTGINVPDLKRFLRYAMIYHRLFREPREGVIAHTAASKLLAEEGQMYDRIGVLCEETWPAACRVCTNASKGCLSVCAD